MIKKEISVNAGILWRLLNDKGILSLRELGEKTNFNSLNIGMALGWLSKENKINFTEKEGILYVELISGPTDIYY